MKLAGRLLPARFPVRDCTERMYSVYVMDVGDGGDRLTDGPVVAAQNRERLTASLRMQAPQQAKNVSTVALGKRHGLQAKEGSDTCVCVECSLCWDSP